MSATDRDALIEMVAMAIDVREEGVPGHADRVARLGMALARESTPELASDPELRWGFLLHDIGYFAVADDGLLERHPIVGAELVTGTSLLSGLTRDVVAFHHERWDGRGYPWGLGGENIPLAARIFALADAFDAMTSTRVHAHALPTEIALQRLDELAGSRLDPALVQPFRKIVREQFPETTPVRRRHLTVAA